MSKQTVLEILKQLGKIGDAMEECPVLGPCPITSLSQVRTLALITFNLWSSMYGLVVHLLIRTLLLLIKQFIPKGKMVNENKKSKISHALIAYTFSKCYSTSVCIPVIHYSLRPGYRPPHSLP